MTFDPEHHLAMRASRQFRYHCIDPVEYNIHEIISNLHLKSPCRVPTLSSVCIRKIVVAGRQLSEQAITCLPSVFAIPLLKQAIENPSNQEPCYEAIHEFIANWPLEHLIFTDVIDEDRKYVFYHYDGFFGSTIAKAIVARTTKCRLRLIDIGPFFLGSFCDTVLLTLLPLASLQRSQRDVERLFDIIVTKAGIQKDRRQGKVLWETVIATINSINNNCFENSSLPECLVLKVNRLVLQPGTNRYWHYLIVHSLRDVLPLTIIVRQLVFDFEVCEDEDHSMEYRTEPLVVLKGHSTETLEGLCLDRLTWPELHTISTKLHAFTNLTALALIECNIHFKNGFTRQTAATRKTMIKLLSALPKLKRLDLHGNTFMRCLHEVLDSCSNPLEYLNLQFCEILEADIDALCNSPHSKTLRELNLSGVHKPRLEKIMMSLKHFKSLRTLWLVSMPMIDFNIPLLFESLHTLPCLAVLYLELIRARTVQSVVKQCTKIKSFQFLQICFLHEDQPLWYMRHRAIQYLQSVDSNIIVSMSSKDNV